MKGVFLNAEPFAEPLQPVTVPRCPLHPQQLLLTRSPALPPQPFMLNSSRHCHDSCTYKNLAVPAHAVPGQVPYPQATSHMLLKHICSCFRAFPLRAALQKKTVLTTPLGLWGLEQSFLQVNPVAITGWMRHFSWVVPQPLCC